MKHHLRIRAAISGAAVVGLLFVGIGPASALGGNNYDCGVSGNYNTRSVSGSGSTQEISGDCGTVGVRLHYTAYVGGPTYWTSYAYHASLASKIQSNTYVGEHYNTKDGKYRTT